jgi:hypothetical protein
MNLNENQTSDELDAYLSSCQRGERLDQVTAVPEAEGRLAAKLFDLAESCQPDPEFVTALEELLVRKAQSLPQAENLGRPPFWRRLRTRYTFLLTGAIILAIAAILVLPLFNPKQLPLLPSLASAAQGQAPSSGSDLFPGTEFILQTQLPEVPESMPVYQMPAAASYTLADARRMAARLGVNGTVYAEQFPEPDIKTHGPGPIVQGQSPSTPASYAIFDGPRQVTVWGGTLSYEDHSMPMDTPNTLSNEQAQAFAEDFLKSRGLLDFPYRVEFVDGAPGAVRFRRLVNGCLVMQSGIQVSVAPDGQVAQLTASGTDLIPVGEYPIRPAWEAWNALINGDMPGGRMQYTIQYKSSSPVNGPMKIWGPEYHSGETAEVYGAIQVYLPVEGEVGQPRLMVAGLWLDAPENELDTLSSRPFREVILEGQIEASADGVLTLKVTGWKDAQSAPTKNFTGTIHRKDQLVLINLEGAKIFLLKHIPQDVEDGMLVDGNGWETGQSESGYPVLEWSRLEWPASSEWQPSDVNSGIAGPQLITSTATLSLTVVNSLLLIPRLDSGQAADGLEGQLQIVKMANPDGSQSRLALLAENPLDQLDGWRILLTGPGLAGIEQYDHLWVRVWGRYVYDQIPRVEVERFEKAYPEQKVQAWLGTLEKATVQNQHVAVLVTPQDDRYVLASSLQWLKSEDEQMLTGRKVLIKGVLRPEELGGFPVIDDLGSQWGSEVDQMTDVQDYQPTLQPEVVIAAPREDSALSGKAFVDQVELVYYPVPDDSMSKDATTQPISIQPLWRFAGHAENGNTFEIFIQAVTSSYLK